MKTDYPTNIKDTIEWVSEAEKEFVRLDREYRIAAAREKLIVADTNYVTPREEIIATIDPKIVELCKLADEAGIEYGRRKLWFEYIKHNKDGQCI